MTLQSLARTIAKARHGTDAMWANYLKAAEAVAALPPMFLPIESAPRDGSHIIGYDAGCVYEVWWDPSGWDDGEWGERPAPSHWLPMPIIAQPDGAQ